MNVTINGYIAFNCANCGEPHTVESRALAFREDTGPEAEEDEYIRYQAAITAPCSACAATIAIGLDVWEHPESVVNYSYYAVAGAVGIECEFDIQHYFDDEAGGDAAFEEVIEGEHQADGAQDDTDENDEEQDSADDFNPMADYMDQYDDED